MDLKDFLNELTKLYVVEHKLKEQKFWSGECFNVFNTLGLRTNEVRVHSAFVAELLNPNGSHGMKDIFLKAFLRTIGLAEDYVAKCRGTIVERSIGTTTKTNGGRIDIILEDGKHAVIIENKIYAGDQENQLLRYHNYAKKNFPEGFQLVYLTLDGHEASEFSTGKNKELDYLCISYGTEIKKWLTECMMQAYDKPLVRETIRQYINLLKELTEQDMEKLNSKQIVELALQNLEGVVAIMENYDELKNHLIDHCIIAPLRQWAEEEGLDFDLKEAGSAEGPALLFKKKDWSHYIAVTRDSNGDWESLYIGVSMHFATKNIIENFQKLDCLNGKGGEWWPYGWKWLSIDNWTVASSFIPMKNGEITDWIKGKVFEIIKEVEAKGLPI